MKIILEKGDRIKIINETGKQEICTIISCMKRQFLVDTNYGCKTIDLNHQKIQVHLDDVYNAEIEGYTGAVKK